MSTPMADPTSRRRFLRFLAGSPFLAAAGLEVAPLMRLFGQPGRGPRAAMDLVQQVVQEPQLIASARDALDVFDFEPVARKKLPPAHWGYLATGTDDDATIRANRDGFTRYELRPRRLVDVSHIDTSIQMQGARWDAPLVVCPIGSQKAFHPDGELAVARAAKAKGLLQVLSTVATSSIEDVTAARGAPVWFQLYHRDDWNQTRQMLKRAEKAGSPVVVLTVDLIGGSNRLTMLRERLSDTRQCAACHMGGPPMPGIRGGASLVEDVRRKPMLADLVPGTAIPEVGTPTWEFVKRLKDATTMKLFIKGIVTQEDAELAVHHGVVGRPYIWGLASFGQEGVETVFALLRRELEMVMRQAGTTSVRRITRDYVAVHKA